MRRGTWILVLVGGVALAAWLLAGEGDAPGPAATPAGGAATPDPVTPVGLAGPGAPAGAVDSPADVAMAGRFRIEGRVSDEAGRPVADVPVVVRPTGPAASPAEPPDSARADLRARLRALRAAPDRAAPVLGRATTDAAGRFHVELEGAASVRIEAVPDPPFGGSHEYRHLVAGQRPAGCRLRVWRGSALRGRVLTAAGAPVSARVTAAAYGAALWGAGPVETDPATGAFSIAAVPRGAVQLTVWVGDGRRIVGATIEAPLTDEVVVVVPHGRGRIRGRVSDGAGVPVAGARVLFRLGLAGGERPASGAASAPSALDLCAESGPDGTFEVPDVAAGVLQAVEVLAEGFLVHVQRFARGGAELAPEGTLTLDLRLARGGAVVGRVTDADGAGLAGAGVRLLPVGGARAVRGVLAAVCDAHGAFRIAPVAPGSYLALPHAAGYYLPEFVAPPSAAVPGLEPPDTLRVMVGGEGAEVQRDLRLVRGLELTGRVEGPGGEPVAGAEVRARGYGLEAHAWGWGVRVGAHDAGPLAVSGADGAFVIPGLAAGQEWWLYARAPGLVGRFSEPIALPRPPAAGEVVLRLLPGAVVRGRVEAPDDETRARALVGIQGPELELVGDRDFRGVAPDGSFEFSGLPPGDWTVVCRGDAAVEAPVGGLGVGEVREGIVLVLPGGGESTGILQDERGDPVAGVLLLFEVEGQGPPVHVLTDGEGRFRFRSPAGRASASTFDAGRKVRVGDAFDHPARDLRLTHALPPQVTFAGQVLDPEGALVPVARVVVRSAAAGAAPMAVVQALQGRFQLTCRIPGPWRLTAADAQGVAGEPLNLHEASVTLSEPSLSVLLRMEAGLAIRGRILGGEGQGLADAEVLIGDRRTTTASDGAFAFVGVAPGSHVLKVTPPAGWVRPAPRLVEAGAADVEVRLHAAAPITGRAYDERGRALRTGDVSAAWPALGGRAAGYANAAVGPGGHFRLDGIPSGARVRVELRPSAGGNGEPARPGVLVEDVLAGTQDLELRVPIGVSIQGVLLEADGRPVPAAWIHAVAVEGPDSQRVRTDPEGRWVCAGLAPGTYRVAVLPAEGELNADPVEVVAPASDVRLVRPPSTVLRGRIEGPAGPGEAPWVVRVRAGETRTVGHVRAEADGTFRFTAVPRGVRLTVWAMRAGDDRYAILEGVLPGPESVVLRPRSGLTITGRVEGATEQSAIVWIDLWLWGGTVHTDAAGRFELRGVPPGRHTVMARGGAAEDPVPLQVEAGANDVVLR